MNTNSNCEMNDRPHPGPLPQERGKLAPSLCFAEASHISVAFRFDESGVATKRLTLRKSVSANRCSFSPGERVRVRASVNNHLKTSEPNGIVKNAVNFTKAIL